MQRKSIYEKTGKKANSEKWHHVAPVMSPSCVEMIQEKILNFLKNMYKLKNNYLFLSRINELKENFITYKYDRRE